MSFLIEYTSYPDSFGEVKMPLGSPSQYQTIKAIEKVPTVSEFTQDSIVIEEEKEFEILFKVVNNQDNSITSHTMTREELSEYIDILKKVLSQTKK